MKVHRYLLPGIVLLVVLASPWIGKLTGDWITTGKGNIEVDVSGAPDPEGIKGWMTLTDVSTIYGVPLDALRAGLKVPADAPDSTPMKDLEQLIPDFETSTARTFVAEYLGGQDVAPKGVPTPAPTAVPGTRLPAGDIKGRTTLAELESLFGVPTSWVLEQLKLSADTNPNLSLKEIADTFGLEVDAMRLLVNEYQAAHP